MRLLTIAIMFIHYLLAPLANASIQAHLEEHHSAHKSHHHSHDHNSDIIHHHHDHDEDSKEQSEEQHEHNLVNIEKAYFHANFKVIKAINLFVLNEVTPLQLDLKFSHINVLNYHYINRPVPPPDTFRSLPLLN